MNEIFPKIHRGVALPGVFIRSNAVKDNTMLSFSRCGKGPLNPKISSGVGP
jgi:hypothetical protein